MKWNKIMNDGYSGRKWEGLVRELREVADQIEAIAPQIRQQT